ncbi:MAG: hypothetical protein MIO93_02055 [ANME-2 cluster archaeon]|nr:hypothetical protein [ANME-2 cluster archaeon]
MIAEDVVNYFIILVGVLAIATILINVFILSKLGNSSLKRLGLQVLGLMIIFFIIGILRSYQAFFNYDYYWMTTMEYVIYSLVYIAASYKLYDLANKYGFNIG